MKKTICGALLLVLHGVGRRSADDDARLWTLSKWYGVLYVVVGLDTKVLQVC